MMIKRDNSRITLLLPKQETRFSPINTSFTFLLKGLQELDIDSRIVEISDDGESNLPTSFGKCHEVISYNDLATILGNNETFIGIDNFRFLKHIDTIDRNKILIWTHYFRGNRFLFKQYVDWMNVGIAQSVMSKFATNLLPPLLTRNVGSIRKYVLALKKRFFFAQSLWTALLFNRVYNLQSKGIIYNPISTEEFEANVGTEDKNQILIYLADDRIATNFNQAVETLKAIKQYVGGYKIASFGNVGLAQKLSEELGMEIKTYQDVERDDLIRLFAHSVFTIAPVYNGTFELVPIESLMSYAPVITYIQPFMEVTGQSPVIANIQNRAEVVSKIVQWTQSNQNNTQNELLQMKNRISAVMDYKVVTSNLLDLIYNP